YDWDWFYGMNILGDPTLKPLGQTELMSTRKTHLSIHTFMDWNTPEIVAPDSESDAFPKIIENNDDKVWVVWESGRSYTNGRSEIYGAYHDAGAWSSAMNIGPHVYWDYCPVIGTDNQNRPVAIWAGFNDGQYDLYYSIYTGSWSSRQLVHTSDPGYDIKPAMIKDNNNNLWTAWESRRNINLDIYASYFNGSVWTSPEQVTAYSTDETTPVMAIDSLDKPWIFFCRRFENSSEIWGSYYTGSQWLASGPISGNQQRAYHPACAVDEDGLIWVVWQSLDTGNPDIFASYFNGSTWSSPIQITTSTESDLFPSLITYTSGVVCCVYQSKTGGDWNIYYTYCVDSTWSSPEIVANLVGADINPQITCSDSNELWICWQSYSTGNWEIMVSHRYGYGIIEQENRTTESVFSVSSTIFSKRLKIITMKAYQEIKIYDIKGSPVKTLSSNQQGHAIWTPGQLPDGAYFICVGNKNTTSTKKVVFLR
ncbi:T9SS type A sorting domain-containing protein, partial [candidate division WOR-3 bacterium]|nr:T9SS type A sorting domain-containing protein [candidate division WOR-3 bacterium]